MVTIADYYQNPEVIKRMLEYCGASQKEASHFNFEFWGIPPSQSNNIRAAADRTTAEFISGWGDWLERIKGKKQTSWPKWDLGVPLEHELDIFRSLWDERNMVYLLDIEYINSKDKQKVYNDPHDVFWKIDSFYRATFETLRGFGITPLIVATGQGYHFIFKTPSFEKDGSVIHVAQELTDIGHVEDTLAGKYANYHGQFKARRPVPLNLGKAFDTSGRLMEFLLHEILRHCAKFHVELPITVGDVAVGNPGKESINFDLSTYADPLYTRVHRFVFSTHSKAKGKIAAPALLTIPRFTPSNGHELSMHDLLRIRMSLDDAQNYAAAIHTEIPDNTEGVEILLERYKASRLFAHHKDFNAVQREPHTKWHKTYDEFDPNQLPPCLRVPFQQPSPALLQPTHIHALTRALTSRGWWHPKHVAGLISSKYERDHGWPYNWKKADAYMHAATWVRIYSGLIACGLDNKFDLNCLSQDQKGLCTAPGCGYRLEDLR